MKKGISTMGSVPRGKTWASLKKYAYVFLLFEGKYN